MTLQAFLDTAWRDHGDQAEAVAQRLAGAVGSIVTPQDLAPFVRLLVHVFGEHLGEWARGVQLLESLRTLPAFDGSADAAGPVTRGIATLRLAGGDASALHGLAAADRACALATAADALNARGRLAEAIAFFGRALDELHEEPAAGHPALRALAVGGNNLAGTLEARPALDPAETAAMLAAAHAGLRFWRLCGGWLEEERAEYMLARCLLRAGDAPAARASIDRCLAICAAHDAPAFERFFGHAVHALAARAMGDTAAFAASRAAALAQHALLPDSERGWCRREFDELGSERQGVAG